MALVENLPKSGFLYLLEGKLGQDPLKVNSSALLINAFDIYVLPYSFLQQFFGIARHVAGDGRQPTVQQFLFVTECYLEQPGATPQTSFG